MATVLIARAAATATRVRVTGDCDDIDTLPFGGLPIAGLADARYYSSSVPIPENRQKRKLLTCRGRFCQPRFGGNSQRPLGNIRHARRVERPNHSSRGVRGCLASLQARGSAKRSQAATAERRAP